MSISEKYDLYDLNRKLDITKSKVFQGSNAGFLAPMLCSMEFIWDEKVVTAATDGIRLWWNPEDFLGCTPAGRVSSLLHELGHAYRLHMLRQGDRCPDVWGIACDIAINRDLLKLGYKLEWWQPGIGPHPEIPFELEEEIYDYLKKPGGDGAKEAHENCCGGIKPLNAADKQQLVNNVNMSIHTAKVNGQPGSIPGNVELILDAFLRPKIAWERVLQRWATDLVEEDHSWRTPSRRYQDIYLPSRITEDGRLDHLVYYFDLSGSVTDKMVIRFNSEIKYIWDTLKPRKLTLVMFDTVIHEIIEFTEGDNFDKLRVTGRGGTSLREVRQHMIDSKATAAIVFSDLECTPMKPGPKCPIIWIVVNNKKATVPFGEMIHIKE